MFYHIFALAGIQPFPSRTIRPALAALFSAWIAFFLAIPISLVAAADVTGLPFVACSRLTTPAARLAADAANAGQSAGSKTRRFWTVL